MSDARTTVALPGGRAITAIVEFADVQKLAAAWPLGMVELVGGVYGLVLGTDEQESWAIKIQLPDLELEHADVAVHVLQVLAAGAAAEMAKADHPGLIVPTAYQRDKDRGMVEVGIAVFAWRNDLESDYQDWLWKVATRVAKALPKEIPGFELPELQFVGLDLRPRSALGNVFVDAGALNGELLLLRHTKPAPEDPLWTGFGELTEIRHVPLIGIVISDEPGESEE